MTGIFRLFALSFVLVMSLSAGLRADAGQGLVVSDPWARASVTATGAAYLVIENRGTADDTLLEVRSGAAEKVEIHTMTMDGMVMKMRRLDALPIEAGETVRLAPGGFHLMLMGLGEPLTEGMSIPLTLVFEKAGDVEISAPVHAAGHAPR
ncbi:MAG: copper chaperone PCu(A)C [Parvibaculum sp.]